VFNVAMEVTPFWFTCCPKAGAEPI